MKIISLLESENNLIKKAKQHDPIAQKKLFDLHASHMLGISRQYIKDFHFAEDVMITGFAKAFRSLDDFDTNRSFGGWLRQITVNEAISFLRKNRVNFEVIDETSTFLATDVTDMSAHLKDIQLYIDQLPEGYKTVFLLFAVEGYKHHEIAQLLDITEGTSKSQLHKAREILKTKLSTFKHQDTLDYGK